MEGTVSVRGAGARGQSSLGARGSSLGVNHEGAGRSCCAPGAKLSSPRKRQDHPACFCGLQRSGISNQVPGDWPQRQERSPRRKGSYLLSVSLLRFKKYFGAAQRGPRLQMWFYLLYF